MLLAHTRLAIVGLGPEGVQPRVGRHSALTYNGEIYNHAQIARSLGGEPPACDTETLHRLLEGEGVQGLAQLDGMFAFAWWDIRSRRLVFARDRWGIKPLYLMRHDDGGMSVASELSVFALLHPRPDPHGVAHYLAFGHTSSSVTVYERVSKVAPGSHAEVLIKPGRHQVRWGRSPSLPEFTGSLEVAVKKSVSDQFMADVPVGLFLSGGVDSTAIASAAAASGASPHCFTVSVPSSASFDESSLAAANAGRLGLPHTTVPVTSADLAARVPHLIRSAGEPLADAALLAVDALAETARQHVKVVLTGEGADELFGGYTRHRLSQRLATLRMGSLISPFLIPVAKAVSMWRSDAPWQRAVQATLQGGGALGYASLQQAELTVFKERDDLQRSLVSQLRTDWCIATHDGGPRLAPLLFDQRRWLPNTYLEKIDRATMRHGLEGRVPFLSNDLTAWAAWTRPTDKAVLRHELTRMFPGVALPSRKRGLSIDVEELLKRDLRDPLERALYSRESIVRESFGAGVTSSIALRALRSPTFAYRVATLAVWSDTMAISL